MLTSQPPNKAVCGVEHQGVGTARVKEGLLGAIELPGVPQSVSRARRFVAEVLGSGHPVRDEVVLLVSELVTNSVTHSDSRDGGLVTLALSECEGSIHVEVLDAGSEGEPQVREDPYGDGGRGLFLVDAISERWGMYRDGAGRVVWFAVRFKGLGPASSQGPEPTSSKGSRSGSFEGSEPRAGSRVARA
ncbi:ATP-binding protein [Sphaerisporangium album]|uniref:ATP-binding protein n=1 Tax=Sphaerisporangium album TaxID=509200 RepID=A0A367FQG4_9ACTN|nr:ATP-binding protein [Sphaerisporangium album]RCG32484.1 ATP-binding protein [Sphaerisporangium album]